MTLDQQLTSIQGNLKDACKQSVPGTRQCVNQLMNERRTNPELRSQWFYTADGNVYSLDNGTPTLRITREATNPILNNIDDAFTQLTTQGNYQVSQADFDAVKAAPDTVTIDLTKLNLQGNEKEWRYLTISTAKPSVMNKSYNKLNPEERTLAERVYGQGTDFVANMQMLNSGDITETRVYVLNPDYVKIHAKDSPVGRASWLVSFDDGSGFNAYVRSIINYLRLRGVRREGERSEPTPEGRAHQKAEVPQAPPEVKYPTFDEVRAYSARFVPEVVQEQFEVGLRNLYKP